MLDKWDMGSSIGPAGVGLMVSGPAPGSQNLTQEHHVPSRKPLLSKDQPLMINPDFLLAPQDSSLVLFCVQDSPEEPDLFYGKSTDGIFFKPNW